MRYQSLLAAAAVAAIASGCAAERPPVDRVQADALEKKFFVGPDLVSNLDNPEFYSQGTLVDVGYGAAQDGLFTSTYAQPTTRIRWEITENFLIARAAYERIEDSDGKGSGGATNDGQVAAMYRISSHFDIVRAYNSTTGEQLNIIEENTRDRVWNEREYFRVDWSQNLAGSAYDYDTLALMGIFGGVSYEPSAYYVNDPTSPDAPVFDLENGYFDVTVKAFAKPGEIDLRSFGWGIDSYPSCFLENDFLSGSWPAGNCNPVELTIRQSYRQIPKSDYEPVNWDGYRFQAYGGFYVERFGYARNYGMSDNKWHRFLARYDIWDRSHFYTEPESMTGEVACFNLATTPVGADPHRDLDGNGTEDECESVGRGSRCDEYTQRCTLPYRDRTVKPIIWYYTSGSNQTYFEPSEWAAHEWDTVMRAAVQTARYSECKNTGEADCDTNYPVYKGQHDMNEDAINLSREVDDCRMGRAYLDRNKDEAACVALADEIGTKRGYDPGVIALAKQDQVVILCHSPVQANDDARCLPEGATALPEGITAEDCSKETLDKTLIEACASAHSVRMGDLRYHQINTITTPQSPSPWGIYTDAEDPLTGESISASVNVWSHVTDLWSQRMVDTSRYIKGELSDADITDGTYIKNWAEASRSLSGGGMVPMMDNNEIDARLEAFAGGLPERNAQGEFNQDSASARRAHTLKQRLKSVRATMDVPNTDAARHLATMELAKGTPFEAELMTNMVQQYWGIAGLPISGGLLDIVSPLRAGNPAFQRDIYRMKQEALASRGACIFGDNEAPAPVATANIADLLEKKFGAFNPDDDKNTQFERAERMRKYLALRVHKAVILHEMGHSLGMRHNFVSSADPWGYRPQYWQLRSRDGKVRQACTGVVADGSDCVGPRYFDRITEAEQDNFLPMWMHQSIMEYPGEATQELLGLGAYDFATIRMLYSDTVAVFSDDSYKANTGRGRGMIDKTDNFGGILGMTWTDPNNTSNEVHYSLLNDRYDLIKDCAPVNVDDYKPANWDEEAYGIWDPTFDGFIVNVDGQYTRCKTQPVEYTTWQQLRLPTEAEAGGFYRGGVNIDKNDRVRVPYGFGTDGWADLGNLSVYRSDNGADPYELFDFFITQQEMNHIFTNYRRNLQGFSVRSASNRALYRYNTKMRDGAKGLGLIKNIYEQVALAEGWNFDDFWPAVSPIWFKENILASGIAFDFFTRQLSRPQNGNHFAVNGDSVLRSDVDTYETPTATKVIIPNGATGLFGDVYPGGRPLENGLADDQGEFDSSYTINAGSYYDKLWTSFLMSESADNFISSSRGDFFDARYRSVSLADMFPDGFRRWLGNNLTGDDELKGPRLWTDSAGNPLVGSDNFPAKPIGWTTWWTKEPKSCFPQNGSIVCYQYGDVPNDLLGPDNPADTVPIDPQVGWEQQKFLIAWTLVYLPANQQRWWLDQLEMWELPRDGRPDFPNRIEFHNPTGMTFVAKTSGKEVIFGKTVQKGIAARMLEYANSLLLSAYETDPGPDLDSDGQPDWYIPKVDPVSGKINVLWDPTISAIDGGNIVPGGKPGCDANGNAECTCSANRACIELKSYVALPHFLRQGLETFNYLRIGMKGVY